MSGALTFQAWAASSSTPTSSTPATSPAPTASAAASVAVVTTRSTVHAAGSIVPAWGLVFLVAVFVVAVAVAFPVTRRRTVHARRG